MMTVQDDSQDDEKPKDKLRRKAMSLSVEVRVLDQLQWATSTAAFGSHYFTRKSTVIFI